MGSIAEKSNSDILDLIGLITGKSSSTSSSGGSTTTQKANISDAGIKEMIQQILSGPGGIASIANAEHSAGLYGGSTATLLTNNLVTQTAAKLAAAQAGTTTTTADNKNSTTKTDPAINPLKAGGALLATSALHNILQGAGLGGIDAGAGSIADLLKSGGSGLASLLKGITGPGGSPINADAAGYNSAKDTGLVSSNLPTDNISPGVGQFLDYGPGTTTIPVSALFPSSAGNGYDNAGSPVIIPDPPPPPDDNSNTDGEVPPP